MYHIMPFRVTMLVGKLTTMGAYYKKRLEVVSYQMLEPIYTTLILYW